MESKFFEFDDNINFDYDDEEVKPSKKLKKTEEEKIKTKNLFDHLKAITQVDYDPEYFDKLNEGDKRTFLIYMINRYLSMNPEWLPIVNYFQQYLQYVSAKEAYKFYACMIPKDKTYLKYIKSEDTKYNKDLINIVSQYYEASIKESIEYLDLLYVIPGGIKWTERLCSKYGYDEKEIKKMIKIITVT